MSKWRKLLKVVEFYLITISHKPSYWIDFCLFSCKPYSIKVKWILIWYEFVQAFYTENRRSKPSYYQYNREYNEKRETGIFRWKNSTASIIYLHTRCWYLHNVDYDFIFSTIAFKLTYTFHRYSFSVGFCIKSLLALLIVILINRNSLRLNLFSDGDRIT